MDASLVGYGTMNERKRKNSVSILWDLRKETDVVVGWDARGLEMPDYMRSVWRSWANENDREGGACGMEKNNWKGKMGKVKTIAKVVVVTIFLLCCLTAVFVVEL
jgi:hypothetical protein